MLSYVLVFFIFSFFLLNRAEAEIDVDGRFLARVVYEDSVSYDLVGAASKVLGKTSSSPRRGTSLSWRLRMILST
jgi:hypothetical protein